MREAVEGVQGRSKGPCGGDEALNWVEVMGL